MRHWNGSTGGNRGRLITVLLATITLALGGCGFGSLDSASGSTGADGAFPVSVAGKLGVAKIPAKPKRVVALSWTDADIALALGVRPVGIAGVPTDPDGIHPWTETGLRGAKPEVFEVSNGDPVPKIIALDPDLILATKDYNLTESYRQLSGFAPVVGYAESPNRGSWQQAVRRIAKALGVPARGERVIAQVNGAIEAARATHPELAGKSFNFGVSPQPAKMHLVNSTQDSSATFLRLLGLRLGAQAQKLTTSSIPGRAELSYENLPVADADILMVTGQPGQLSQLESNPLFKRLQVVRRDAYLPLNPTIAQAIAFPSPLSLRWAIDKIVPRLSEAARR